MYHKTPDKQTKESYTHPEDIEHFAHHQKIEAEEERRERHAEGMPSMEEDARRKKEAELRGEKYVSPYEAQMPKEGSPTAPQHAYDEHAAHPYAQEESLQSTEHVFRTPEGVKVVKSDPVRADPGKPDTKEGHGHTGADTANKLPHRMEGETDEGYKDRLAAFEKSQQAEAAYARVNPDLASPGVDPKTGEPKQMAGESYEEFRRRAGRAKFEEKQRTEPFRPTSKQDLRKSAPYKVSCCSQDGDILEALLRAKPPCSGPDPLPLRVTKSQFFLIFLHGPCLTCLQYPPIQNRIKKSSFFVSRTRQEEYLQCEM